ncbi:sugar ABC transporter substrate-binding protein [Herbiconiux moechotypicola]|uniref:Sugar ABC transporter substrate-binding protein n=1 Tax=Herbiconiux moechotypicola TaxID=637393 RepID=A0ABP5Q6N4_9MICO|nr:sugar ABC transporter substrate-binding protein [Herbiconiux moechotypicola]MCS5728994.1 sugar ABC transporter substrate-binding protein [Herbiconiux moechotypicola]
MRRHTTLLVAMTAVAATAIGLSGCSSSGSDSGTGEASGTISVWTRDSQASFMNKLADEFNATHDDLKVEVTLVPAADFVQKFGTAAAGGNAPDVASMDLVYAPYFASAGALADITDRVDTLPYAGDMSPGHTAQGQYEGKTYALPFTGDVSVMYYNKDLFTAAGLDPETPPTTMAEVQAAAEAITALGDGDYGFAFSGACGGCNIFSMTPYTWASGGNVLSDDGKDALLDSAEVTDMLTMYRDLWQGGAMPELVQSDSGSNAGDAFKQGKVGIFNWGNFYLSSLTDPTEGAQFDWGLALIPGAEAGQTGSFAGGDDIAITAGAKNPDGAWTFLEWVTGDEGQKVIADNGVMPTRLDLLDSLYVPQDPRYEVFAEALAVAKVPYSVIENELFNDSNGVWSTMIQEAVFGSGTVEEAQAKAQKAAQALLDESNQ